VTRRPGDPADRGVPAAQVIPVPLIEGENALDPGVDPVGSVDVGKLAAPAADLAGQVGHPQGVPPAVFGLEQGQLRAGAGPLAAGEDPHLLGPSVELVPSGAVAQQAGQLGDVRFFDPAPADSRGQGAGGGAGAPVHHHVASPADPDGAARFGVLGQTTLEGGVAHPGQVQQLANVGSLVRREAQREPQRFVRADWPGTVAGGSIRVDACWQGSLFVASVGCSRDEVATGAGDGQTPAWSARLFHARHVGVGLFVPKPSTGAACQRRSTRGLRQTVRACPLASTAVGGDCHSLRHSVACELVVSDCCLPHAFQVCGLASGLGRQGP
jgi:hypothetical protein